MRGKQRGQQKIYLATITEVEKVDEYGDKTGETTKTEVKGTELHCSISLKGQPIVVTAGVVADYERILTFYKKQNLKEGDRLFIDSDTKSDYVITSILETDKGQVFRYGIKKHYDN